MFKSNFNNYVLDLMGTSKQSAEDFQIEFSAEESISVSRSHSKLNQIFPVEYTSDDTELLDDKITKRILIKQNEETEEFLFLSEEEEENVTTAKLLNNKF